MAKTSSSPTKPESESTTRTKSQPEDTSPAKPKGDNSSLLFTLIIVCFFVLLVLVPTVILPALQNSSSNKAASSDAANFVGIDKYLADEGYLAPLFQLADSEGNVFTLESYRGRKPVVIIFETTWCGYCRTESPYVEALRTKYGDQVEFATVDLAEDQNTVNAFRSTNNIQRPWLLDLDKKVATAYSSFSTPSHFFISKDGYIQNLRIGYLEQEALERYIKQLL